MITREQVSKLRKGQKVFFVEGVYDNQLNHIKLEDLFYRDVVVGDTIKAIYRDVFMNDTHRHGTQKYDYLIEMDNMDEVLLLPYEEMLWMLKGRN